MKLDILIEALLFYKAAPQSKKLLLKLFDISSEDLQTGISTLRERIQNGGLRLIETETDIQLVTAPELSEFMSTIAKEELATDIGKAGAETLAIILYREPISRAEIDRIRGVNSSFILRNLLTRGLISREAIGNSYQFRITSQLLQQLGISSKHDLPQFSEFMNALDTFDTTTT